MKKINNEKLNRMAVLILLIVIIFMSVIAIEVITIVYTKRINLDALKDREKTTQVVGRYSGTDEGYKKFKLKDDHTFIKDTCKNGCKMKIDSYGKTYLFRVEKNDKKNYILSIINGNQYLLKEKNIGSNLEQAYFFKYSGYLAFFNVIITENYEYDYAVFVDNKNDVDEFASLYKNEMEFNKDGITYYYDECNNDKESLTNGIRVHAERFPYSKDVKVVDTFNVDYAWCE